MTSSTPTTIPDHTGVHDELTLRMLGANVTFTRGQWAELLGSLRPDGDLYARVDELLTGVRLNAAQRAAIAESVANYAANSDADLIGWKVVSPDRGWHGTNDLPVGALFVEFTYREKCPGHPCEDAADLFPHAGIGDTHTCDGTCQQPGREVTIFATDGKVLDSQDFG